MQDGRPAPGEVFHDGPVTEPRRAATVILLRDGPDGLEVLLVQRNPRARFMGGAWVFPGGAVDPGEGHGEAAVRAAGVRELNEEAGIALRDADELVAFSRWITPARSKIRYDTEFFLAALPDGQEPRIDGSEIVAVCWSTPAAALDAAHSGEMLLVFPTIKTLEQLSAFTSVDGLVGHARDQPVRAVEPRVVGEGETARIVLPDERRGAAPPS
ncbi:MAG: NUDIX hydrolase [Solirubrobacterales bacterium]|nr:NUDIX hydrolase [Solirubrobacterales bacterium]